MDYDGAIKLIKAARCPEDVFESLAGDQTAALQDRFRVLAKIVHPDKHGDNAESTAAFALLESWRGKAQDKIARGTYGNRVTATLKTKSESYSLFHQVAVGDLSEVYAAENIRAESLVVKVTRGSQTNDLLLNEAKKLRYLRDESASRDLKVMAHIPELVDSFNLRQGREARQINVLTRLAGYVPLSEVVESFPNGIDPRDAAWMWNRLLGAFVAAHQAGLVHGAVTPDHVMIAPESHGGVLIDWCYSVERGQALKAIVPKWKALYPPEVFEKARSTFGVDLYMSACCFIALIGGRVQDHYIPSGVPRGLRGFIRSCLLPAKHRNQDAWELHEEFAELLCGLYGPRTFRPFAMPAIA